MCFHTLHLLVPVVLLAGCGGTTTETVVPSTQEPASASGLETNVAEVALAATATSAAASDDYDNPLTAEEIAAGWISLFDGVTLFGWQSNNDEVNWRVEDGVIVADAGPIGLLNTTVPFADYELKVEFRFSEGGNSGIFLRTVETPQNVKTDCYELNLADTHPEGFTTGGVVGHQTTKETILASGNWHTFFVRLEGNHLLVKLDDETILDYIDEAKVRDSGFIGLQHNQGQAEFRRVLLRPLGLTDLFNGSDLSGWRITPGVKSDFQVQDGVIRVTDGPGFLETEETFGDFVFQAESFVHGRTDEGVALNSGYFFRSMPGTEQEPSNGYEVQIDNGFKGDDRTQPTNAGTGAIFRRVDARRVVSNDDEWFTTTLVASGPRIAVWVNGYAVVDWVDTREPDENPRRGLRLKPGHIILQGHDPTTNLSFRNLRIAELP